MRENSSIGIPGDGKGQKAIILAAARTPGQRNLGAIPLVKLHLTRGEGRNHITGTGDGYVSVNGTRYEHSIVITADRVVPWPVAQAAELEASHIAALLEQTPEIALLGTGARLTFPPAAVLRPLIEARIGYEVMDTGAACRTYGILMAEGRRVVAALIV